MTPAPGSTLMRLSLASIVESPDNPRQHFDEAFIAELAKSFQEIGQMNPVLVRPHPKQTGKYELAAGATRLRAGRVAKLEMLDAIVKPMSDEEFTVVLVFENLKRRDLRPLEEARGYQLLLTRSENWTEHWTVEKIAKKSGVSIDYVRDRLRLLRLAPAAVKLVELGKLPIGHALELAKLTKEQQEELCDGKDFGDIDSLFQYQDIPDVARGVTEAERKKDPTRGYKLCSLAELRARIEDFAIDLKDEATPDLFPEMVAAVKRAEEKAVPVVFISTDWTRPHVEKGEAPILSRQEWKRADGTKGAKACKFAASLGVGRLGELRGQAFTVCTAITECRTHFANEIATAERDRKWREDQAKARSGAGRKPKETSWEKSARLRREAIAAMRPAYGAIRTALGEKIATASVKPSGAIADLLLHGQKQIKPEARKRFADDLLRQMAYTEALSMVGSEWQLDRLRKFAKAVGVDLKALVKAHAPKPKKAPAKGKAKKRGKAA
jgi:ParB/RepB/Spo0J family partition protein